MYLHNRVTNEDVPAEISSLINICKMSKKFPNYTLEELADAHIIPAKLTPKERAEVDAEMHVFRMRILAEMTEDDKRKSNIHFGM
jgi:hypothetical protein